jgi:hypothetical protein
MNSHHRLTCVSPFGLLGHVFRPTHGFRRWLPTDALRAESRFAVLLPSRASDDEVILERAAFPKPELGNERATRMQELSLIHHQELSSCELSYEAVLAGGAV